MTTIHFPRLRDRREYSFLSRLRSILELWSRRARQRNAFHDLNALDDHILRDIGVERSLVVLAANVGVERLCAKIPRPDKV